MLAIKKTNQELPPCPTRARGAHAYKKALEGVSFTLEPGLCGLIGPNGAGKRTRINILTGGLAATKDKLRWNDKSTVGLGKKFRCILRIATHVLDAVSTNSTFMTSFWGVVTKKLTVATEQAIMEAMKPA